METKKRVSQACEACKLRKVKCNGQQRCQQCTHLGLRCIYSPSNMGQRTQGKRGQRIAEYKNSTKGAASQSAGLLAATEQRPLFDQAFFLGLLPNYRQSVYPTQPVITEDEIKCAIQEMEADQEAKALVFAFGAVTLNLACTGEKRTDDVSRKISILVEKCIEARGPTRPKFRATVRKAMISTFLHNCLMTAQDQDTAFFYVRDAISIIQLLHIDSPGAALSISPVELARRQRLYWQAFVHERFLAILDYRHAVLPPLRDLPNDDPTIPIAVQDGFNQIIKLFRLLDSEFLQNWLGNHDSTVTPAWIESKYRELNQQVEDTADDLAILTNMQRADLIVTQQWLRTLVWRLAMSQTLLSSQSSKECLSLLFPVRLSQQLCRQVSRISREAIEVHGSGIVQKLFEITDTIADVVIHIPAPTLEESANRVDDFLFLLHFLFTFPTLDQTRRQILTRKREKVQGMLPQICSNPNSLTMTHTAAATHEENPWYSIAQSMMPTGDPSQQVVNPVLHGFNAIHRPESSTRDNEAQARWDDIARRLSITEPSV